MLWWGCIGTYTYEEQTGQTVQKSETAYRQVQKSGQQTFPLQFREYPLVVLP